ncbi:MAG: asparagine synthase-related protein [Candidatus Methanomethyliaceae archaeon]|nr:asparagine synthase-related protein [Candidatus Methanomethyliaceae archaeon]MDW7970293.1 asparagine synthase-related protein [Nitrososphaerota archaeon]
MSYESILMELLMNSIKSFQAEAILFSGGIDSSLIAILTSKIRPVIYVTAIFNTGNDEKYSFILSKKLGVPCVVVRYDIEEAIDASREIVRTFRTFDHVEIRNDITLYIALKKCKEMGIRKVMTGDGGDELFAGYDFMVRMEEHQLEKYINEFYGQWFFSSSLIGRELGIEVYHPFLREEIINFARSLPYEWKVKRPYGKWILRKLLDAMGFPEIAWRNKEPIEMGSGSSIITQIFLKMLGEEAEKIEKEALKDGVKFWSKEQIYFYKLFKEMFGPPPRAENGCPYCGSPLSQYKCKYCGYVRRYY